MLAMWMSTTIKLSLLGNAWKLLSWLQPAWFICDANSGRRRTAVLAHCKNSICLSIPSQNALSKKSCPRKPLQKMGSPGSPCGLQPLFSKKKRFLRQPGLSHSLVEIPRGISSSSSSSKICIAVYAYACVYVCLCMRMLVNTFKWITAKKVVAVIPVGIPLLTWTPAFFRQKTAVHLALLKWHI